MSSDGSSACTQGPGSSVLQSIPWGPNTPPAAFVEGARTDTISISSSSSITSSQAAAVAGITSPGSSSFVERPSPSAVGLLSELGVSQDSLQRLFTAGCADGFEQPVWMVVNLQGRIKGSYTPVKMMEFCMRGTLSPTQLLLGIDHNLPYLARQDLSFYRTLSELLLSVHAGSHYTPLSEDILAALQQQGVTGRHWQPLQTKRPPHTHGCNPTGNNGSSQQGIDQGAGPCQVGGESSSSHLSSTAAASSAAAAGAAAAASQLHMALERLCGCSVVEAMLSDPITTPSPAAGGARRSGGRGCSSSPTAAAVVNAAESEALKVAATGATVQDSGSDSTAAATEDNMEALPKWLYINHLGWCRGPFSAARVIQAHMCGRLPRDTLIAAHQPDVPSAAISSNIAAFFRPLGVLLDNVVNGWTYNFITSSHVGALLAAMLGGRTTLEREPAAAADTPWQPLKWTGTGPPPPLVNPQQLQPPQAIPCCLPPLTAGGRGRGGRGTAAVAGRRAAGVARRTAAIAPSSSLVQNWQQQQRPAQQYTSQGWQQQLHQQQTVQQDLQGRQWPQQQLLLTSQQQVGSSYPLDPQQQQQHQEQPYAIIQGYGHGLAADSTPAVAKVCFSAGLHHSGSASTTSNPPLVGMLATSLHRLQLQSQSQVQLHPCFQQQQQQPPVLPTAQVQHQQGYHQPQGQLQQVQCGSAAHPVGGVLLGHLKPANSLSALPASVAVQPAQSGLAFTSAVTAAVRHLQTPVQLALQQQPQLQPVQLVLQQQQHSLPVTTSSVLSDQLQSMPPCAGPDDFQPLQQGTGGLRQTPCVGPSVMRLQQQPAPAGGQQPVHALLQPDHQGLLQPVFQPQPQIGITSAWMCNWYT